MPKHADGKVSFFGNTPLGRPESAFNVTSRGLADLPENGFLEPKISGSVSIWTAFGESNEVASLLELIKTKIRPLVGDVSSIEVTLLLMITTLGFFLPILRKSTFPERLKWLGMASSNESLRGDFMLAVDSAIQLQIAVEKELRALGSGFFTANTVNMRFQTSDGKFQSLYLRLAKLISLHEKDFVECHKVMRDTLLFLGYDLNFRPQTYENRITHVFGAPRLSNLELQKIDSNFGLKQLVKMKKRFDLSSNMPFETSMIFNSSFVSRTLLNLHTEQSSTNMLLVSSFDFSRYLLIRVIGYELQVAKYFARPKARRVSAIKPSNWIAFADLTKLLQSGKIDYESLVGELKNRFQNHI